MKYEAFENNGGALMLVILDDEGKANRIFENWEYVQESGILKDCIQQLREDPLAYEGWDGDMVERLNNDEYFKAYTAETFYDEGLGDIVAEGDESNDWLYVDRMGINARDAFDIAEEYQDEETT